MVSLIRLLFGPAYTENRAISALTVSRPLDELAWTLFRVPFLAHGGAGSVHAGYMGDGGDGRRLSRTALVRWCLGELEEGRWIGKVRDVGLVLRVALTWI